MRVYVMCTCVHMYMCAHEAILSCLCVVRSCHSVQVAPKVSTSHYTMVVIMYMRVSEEGKEGRGGELVGGEEKGRKESKEESVAAHYILGSSVGPHGRLACGWSVFVCVCIDFTM